MKKTVQKVLAHEEQGTDFTLDWAEGSFNGHFFDEQL